MKVILKKSCAILLMLTIFLCNKSFVYAQNTEESRLVTEEFSGQTYYIKGNHKALYWHEIDNKYYYFGKDGAMVIGWNYIPEPVEGVTLNQFEPESIRTRPLPVYGWYYFDENGAVMNVEKTGMYYLEERNHVNTNYKKGSLYSANPEKEWYFLVKGLRVPYLETGWIFYNDSWYYMKQKLKHSHTDDNKPGFSLLEEGEMFYGWLKYRFTWYHLNEVTGQMTTGWLYDNDNWYYLAKDGTMKTGWYQVNNKWYYSVQSGELVTNSVIDGYSVNHNGEWVK